MKIEIIKRTTTYLERKEGEERKEPEISEVALVDSFEFDSELATALLWLLNSEDNYPEINKDGNLEVSRFLNGCNGQQEKELVIKFIK